MAIWDCSIVPTQVLIGDPPSTVGCSMPFKVSGNVHRGLVHIFSELGEGVSHRRQGHLQRAVAGLEKAAAYGQEFAHRPPQQMLPRS